MKSELICEYCGTIITENDKHCPNCGANCSSSIKKYRIEQEKIRLERLKNREIRQKKSKKKSTIISLIILIIGLSIGGYMIYLSKTTPAIDKVSILEKELNQKKKELEEKGIKYNTFSKYTDGEAYDLKIINEAMDPSFDYCNFNEYKNNSLTKEYCKYKNRTGDSYKYVFLGLGIFIIIATCMFSLTIFGASRAENLFTYPNQPSITKSKDKSKKETNNQ